MVKIIFVFVIFLLFVWRINKGFQNGIMQEFVNIISGVVSLLCVALIFFAVSSYLVKAMSMLTLCVIGLIVLGIAFKLCGLIFKPIMALSNISIIGGLDKMFGAVLGAVEALVLSGLIYFVLDYMGIYVL